MRRKECAQSFPEHILLCSHVAGALTMDSHDSTHCTHPLKSFSEQQQNDATSWKCSHHSRCSFKMLPMCCSLDNVAQLVDCCLKHCKINVSTAQVRLSSFHLIDALQHASKGRLLSKSQPVNWIMLVRNALWAGSCKSGFTVHRGKTMWSTAPAWLSPFRRMPALYYGPTTQKTCEKLACNSMYIWWEMPHNPMLRQVEWQCNMADPCDWLHQLDRSHSTAC
jgi:hypothetical protein